MSRRSLTHTLIHSLLIISILVTNVAWLIPTGRANAAAGEPPVIVDTPVVGETALPTAVTPQPYKTVAPTATATTVVTDTPVATNTPSATPTSGWTNTPEVTNTPVATSTPEPTLTATPLAPSETPTLPLPTATLTATATPVATDTPVATATLTATATATPGGQIVGGLHFSVEGWPLEVNPGDVITLTWQLNGFPHGLPEGLELAVLAPASFEPLGGNGLYDPTANLLTLTLTQTEGSQAWYIGPLAEAPYLLHGELRQDGELLAEDDFTLVRRGPAGVSAHGGQVQGFNGRVQVTFPDGALPEDAWITVRPPQNGQGLGGLPFELLAVGQASGQEIRQFNQPVTIEVKYTGKPAADEGTLTLFYYDEEMQTWRPLATQVDRQGRRLIAQSDHFTLFDFQAQNWEAARLPSMEAFQVSGFTGAAAYNFSIEVPPGPGGLQPSLSLSYNSQTVDGSSSRGQASWVGMGWSLDTGYIQRSMNGTPTYFEDDTFSLQVNGVGGLLLPIADQDGNPDTIDYRLADENFWQVRQYLSDGDVDGYNGDTSFWVIRDGTGTRYYFGNYANNSTGGHAWYPTGCHIIYMQTWRWSLTRVRNIFGRELTYTYYKELAPEAKFTEGCSENPANMAVAVYPYSITYPNGRYRVYFVPNLTLRSDYDPGWEDAQARTLYQRTQLQYIEVWQDPDGVWWNGDEEIVRRYKLGFGENGQQIMPGNTWPAGGKTPTLTSITEYGTDGGALPSTSFWYGDGLHLTLAENGYGGQITFGYYDAWGAAQGADPMTCNTPDGTLKMGTVYPDEGYPSYCGVNNDSNFNTFEKYYQPGGVYLLTVHAKRGSIVGNWMRVGLNTGGGILWGSVTTLGTSWTTVSAVITLPVGASQARPVFECHSTDGCYVQDYKVEPLVTRYRVNTKTLTDLVTGESAPFNYQYTDASGNDTAAVNDGQRSACVANPDCRPLLTPPYSEFRGHSEVRETGPDGNRVTVTRYAQDDYYKGQVTESYVRYGDAIPPNEVRYSWSYTNYTYQTFATANLPHPENQPNDPYHDLEVVWVHPYRSENRTYEGAGSYVARQTEYFFDPVKQGGTQYGNQTETIESYWTGSAWVRYRATRTQYYPNPSGSLYLVRLPGYTNTFQCPGGTCDFTTANATSSIWYLYDGASLFSTPPTYGKLTGQRTLLYYDEPNLTEPKYRDVDYAYDSWGNRTTVTTYTDVGSMYSRATTGARSSFTCYGTGGTLDGQACADDGYRSYVRWERNDLGHPTSITYDYRLSVPISLTDSNSVVTTATYDQFGRLLTIVRPGDDSSNPTVQVSYHAPASPGANNPFWTEARQRITGSTYFVMRKYYGGTGNLLQTQVVGAKLGASTMDIRLDSYYDGYGQVVRQSVPYTVATGAEYQARDTSRQATYTSYDILGRPLLVTATDGTHPAEYSYAIGYNGSQPYQQTQVTDARGYATSTRADIWGRTILVDAPTGPSVSYTYDTRDQLQTATRGGVTVDLDYDLGGRKTSMVDPDMGTWQYAYNALGELTRQTDARDQSICMYYDGLGRLTGKHYRIGNTCLSSPTMSVTYTYDAGTYGDGRRTGMTDASGSTTWVYDARGRVTSETKVVSGGGTFKTEWGYNSADLLAWMKYPGNNTGGTGEQVNYTYHPQMLVDTAIGTNTYVFGTEYDGAGRVQLRKLGTDGMQPVLQVDYAYYGWTTVNGAGRLQYIWSGTPADPDNLQKLYYTYDAVGNILTIRDFLDQSGGNPQTQTFTYDGLGRLANAKAENGAYGTYPIQSYNYNSASGNLMSKAGVSYSYSASVSCTAGTRTIPHAVSAAGGNTYGYDCNGNQIQRVIGADTYVLTYDHENRLTQVTKNGVSVATFVYDGDGNRVKGVITNGPTTIYIGSHFEWANGTPVKYYSAGGTRVAMRIGTNAPSFLLGDHLGSTAITVSADGTKAAEMRYMPWGEQRYASGTTPTSFRFTGQRQESSLGLYFYGARWYDPALGRFAQADTITPQQQGVQAWDRYAYTNNNPVRFTDPTGHCIDGISTIFCAMAIGAVIGATVSTIGYVAIASLTGQEITAGGLAGAAVAGAIGGAVSVIAAPLAGTIGLSVSAGAAVINGTASAVGYMAGGAVSNAVDRSEGRAPQFTPTLGGMAISAVTGGALSYAFGQALPVTSGQYSLAQASYFLPGRSIGTMFATQNAIYQYGQILWTTSLGASTAVTTAPPQPKPLRLQPAGGVNYE